MPVLMVSLNTWPQVGFSRKRSMRAVLVGDDDAELERVLDRDEADGGQRLVLVVEGDDPAEVDVGEHVAGDHEEALVELVHGVADRAGRAERLLLGGVDHPHAELGAVAEVGADVVGQEGDGDDDLVEAVLLQQLDDVLHHRPVGQRQHRLGGVRGERPQAGALAAGHDHGLHVVEPTRGTPGPARPARQRLRGRSGTYMTSGDVAEDQAGDAGDPGEHLGGVGPAEGRCATARNSGKANIRPKVPALPNQVTSMRRAPSSGEARWWPPATSTSRTSTASANQTGTEPSMMMPPTPTKNSSRSATGSSTLPSVETWSKWRAM